MKKKIEKEFKVGALQLMECERCGKWYAESNKLCPKCEYPNDFWRDLNEKIRGY